MCHQVQVQQQCSQVSYLGETVNTKLLIGRGEEDRKYDLLYCICFFTIKKNYRRSDKNNM
jgi:hypothetical protein